MNTQTENTQIEELTLVIADTNGLSIESESMREIAEILRPIADSLPAALHFADTVTVTNSQESKIAVDRRDEILADHKKALEAINGFGDGLIDRLFRAHRRWTAFRNLFSGLDDAQKKIKRAVMDYQEAEERKARAEEIRLQAIADATARKERDRLEKEAAALKTPEKKEQRLEAAAAVVAPVITVSRPVAAVKSQKRWFAEVSDLDAFLKAAANDANIRGYIAVDTTKLARGKSANSMLEIAGITFKQISV